MNLDAHRALSFYTVLKAQSHDKSCKKFLTKKHSRTNPENNGKYLCQVACRISIASITEEENYFN